MPYCEHCSAFNDIGVEQCIFCGNPVFEDVIDDAEDPDEYISLGKNIGIGLAFFIVIGIASGIGIFISIVASGDSIISFGAIGSIMIIGAGPVLALIIGIVQGKMASESIGGLIAGGVTGAVGYIFLMLIVLGFLFAAVEYKYPSDDDDADDDDETIENFGELATQFAAILLPSAIIGAFAGFITNKYIFRPRIIFRASGWGQPPPPPPSAPPPPPPQPIAVQAPPPYQGPPSQPQQAPFPMPQPQPYPPPQQFQGPPQPYPPQQQPPQQPPQQQQQRF